MERHIKAVAALFIDSAMLQIEKQSEASWEFPASLKMSRATPGATQMTVSLCYVPPPLAA